MTEQSRTSALTLEQRDALALAAGYMLGAGFKDTAKELRAFLDARHPGHIGDSTETVESDRNRFEAAWQAQGRDLYGSFKACAWEFWQAAQCADHIAGISNTVEVLPGATPFSIVFPTILRKMWSGSEVQRWLSNLPPLYTAPPAMAAVCDGEDAAVAAYDAALADNTGRDRRAFRDGYRAALSARTAQASPATEPGPYDFSVKLGDRMYIDSSQQYRNGTVTLTIKRKPRDLPTKDGA